jgi:outer membrane receptor protein involved in Fe transport
MNVGLFVVLRLVDNGDSSNRGGGGGTRLSKEFGKFKLSFAAEASKWDSDVYSPLTSLFGLMESDLLFSGDFKLNLSVSRNAIDHSEERLEIPLAANQAILKATQGLGFGLSVDASGSFMTLENLLKTSPQGGATTADGAQVSWQVGLTWSPIKWLSFSFNQYISNYDWSHMDPAANRLTWDGSVPDYQELSTLNLKIYRTF